MYPNRSFLRPRWLGAPDAGDSCHTPTGSDWVFRTETADIRAFSGCS